MFWECRESDLKNICKKIKKGVDIVLRLLYTMSCVEEMTRRKS